MGFCLVKPIRDVGYVARAGRTMQTLVETNVLHAFRSSPCKPH